MAHPLVAIRERVILNQGEGQRRCLLGEVWIQVCPAKRLTGQSDRSLQASEAAQSRARFCSDHEPAVEVEDLTERQVSH